MSLQNPKHSVFNQDIGEVLTTSHHSYKRFAERTELANKSLQAFRESIARAEFVPDADVDGQALIDHCARCAYVFKDGNVVTTIHASRLQVREEVRR